MRAPPGRAAESRADPADHSRRRVLRQCHHLRWVVACSWPTRSTFWRSLLLQQQCSQCKRPLLLLRQVSYQAKWPRMASTSCFPCCSGQLRSPCLRRRSPRAQVLANQDCDEETVDDAVARYGGLYGLSTAEREAATQYGLADRLERLARPYAHADQ